MSKFDDFIYHYQDFDLLDVQSSIFEILSELGINSDNIDIDTIITGLFARGYVIVLLKDVKNG
jgi:hypothetical protein